MDATELNAHREHAATPAGAISYLDVGQGRPALFIHGVLTNALLWRHVISATASQHRRCIAVDLPGHGHTPPIPERADVSLTALAQRVTLFEEPSHVPPLFLQMHDADGSTGSPAGVPANSRGRRR